MKESSSSWDSRIPLEQIVQVRVCSAYQSMCFLNRVYINLRQKQVLAFLGPWGLFLHRSIFQYSSLLGCSETTVISTAVRRRANLFLTLLQEIQFSRSFFGYLFSIFTIRMKAGFVRKIFYFFTTCLQWKVDFLLCEAGKSGIFACHSLRVWSSPNIFTPIARGRWGVWLGTW